MGHPPETPRPRGRPTISPNAAVSGKETEQRTASYSTTECDLRHHINCCPICWPGEGGCARPPFARGGFASCRGRRWGVQAGSWFLLSTWVRDTQRQRGGACAVPPGAAGSPDQRRRCPWGRCFAGGGRGAEPRGMTALHPVGLSVRRSQDRTDQPRPDNHECFMDFRTSGRIQVPGR